MCRRCVQGSQRVYSPESIKTSSGQAKTRRADERTTRNIFTEATEKLMCNDVKYRTSTPNFKWFSSLIIYKCWKAKEKTSRGEQNHGYLLINFTCLFSCLVNIIKIGLWGHGIKTNVSTNMKNTSPLAPELTVIQAERLSLQNIYEISRHQNWIVRSQYQNQCHDQYEKHVSFSSRTHCDTSRNIISAKHLWNIPTPKLDCEVTVSKPMSRPMWKTRLL